jgi:methionyl-tRNA formyltransferase
MKILFIGSTKRGFLTLQELIRLGADIVGVVSLAQDPHEVERYEGAIRDVCHSKQIPLVETNRVRADGELPRIVKEWGADIGFVVGCRVLLPSSVYRAPARGCLAVHDSLLPEYRGFAPLNWSILNGADQTGVTLFYLDERMDGGDIVSQRAVSIGPDESAAEVYERICDATVELIRNVYPALLDQTAPRTPQDYTIGSFTAPRVPEDGWIDWTQPTSVIHNRVRALGRPYPGAVTVWGGERLIVWRAAPAAPQPTYVGRIPGRVVQVNAVEGWVDALTGDGVLRIFEVQASGREPQRAAAVIRSIRATLGISPLALLDRIEALAQRVAELEERSKRESVHAEK